MKSTIVYKPISYQRKFHFSDKPKVYLSGGYGSGKTYSLVMKMFRLMSLNYGLPGGLLCPTLKMFKRDVLPTIKEICEKNNIAYQYHQTDYVFYFPTTDTQIYIFHGEDHGASIRGPNLAFMLINEVTLISKDTFDAAQARVRLKKASLLQIAMSGTPEGFNWNYEYFVENPRDDTAFILGDVRLNTHVSSGYVQSLVESYDALMVEQYVGGKFVNLTGNRACYSFDRQKHTNPNIEKIEHVPVWVSLDFNVNPMAATLWNRLPLNHQQWLRAFDEIALQSSDTHEMARAILEKIDPQDEVVIFPDPAGNARSTKSHGMSDIDILRQFGFTDIRFKSRIASVRDCLNAANNMFDKNRVVINSKKCKNFIADLEQCTLKSGTSEIDKSNPKRSHWLDGFKDMVDYEFPIRVKGQSREQRIR